MELTQIESGEHEQVLRVQDADSGLTGIIALHSTQLGPAAGGLRMRSYADEAAALEDALRLSRGMTSRTPPPVCRWAGQGGDHRRSGAGQSPALLSAFGRAVERWAGATGLPKTWG